MGVDTQFETRRQSFKLRTVTLTAATYTVRTGRSEDNRIIDRVVDAAQSPTVITVPNGVYEGQRLLIKCSDTSIIGIVDVNTTTGDDADLNETDEYISLEWVNATSGWQTVASHT